MKKMKKGEREGEREREREILTSFTSLCSHKPIS